MNIHRLIALCFLLATMYGSAQLFSQSRHPHTDSLLVVSKEGNSDSLRHQALMRLIWDNLSYDPAYSLEKSDELRNIGLSLNDQHLIAKSDHYGGIAYRFLGDFDKSIALLQKAVSYFRSVDDAAQIKNPLFHLGVGYSLKGDYADAMRIYYDQLALAEVEGDSVSIGTTYNSIGILHKNLKEFAKAKEIYHQAIKYLKTRDGKGNLAMTYSNLAVVHLRTSNLDSALYFNAQAIDLEKGLGRQSGISWTYNQRADILREMGELDSAAFYLERAREINLAINNQQGLMQDNISLSRYYNEVGDFSKALDLAEDAHEIASIAKHWTSRKDALYELQNAYKGLGNYQKAYELREHWQNIRDSLLTQENSAKLNELNVQYESVKKDKEIAQAKFLLAQKTSQRNLLLLLVGLCLATLLYFWSRFQFTRHIAQQETKIQEQRILQLEKEHKISNMASMIEGQEAERRRIAKDLHDGLGVLLSAVKGQIGQIQTQIAELENINIYQRTNDMLDKACDEVRRISHNMIPGVLRIEGMQGALEDLVDQLRTVHHMRVEETLQFDPDKVTEAQAHMIYRVLQEGVNNMVKHSQASEVVLQMIDYPDHVHILLEDNGIGYDQSRKSEGLGLQSMRSRVDFLNGEMAITSSEAGTSIEINIPT